MKPKIGKSLGVKAFGPSTKKMDMKNASSKGTSPSSQRSGGLSMPKRINTTKGGM